MKIRVLMFLFFVLLFAGCADKEKPNGEPDYQFEWEGKRFTEEKFYEEIDKVFPLEKGVRSAEWKEWMMNYNCGG